MKNLSNVGEKVFGNFSFRENPSSLKCRDVVTYTFNGNWFIDLRDYCTSLLDIANSSVLDELSSCCYMSHRSYCLSSNEDKFCEFN